MGVRGEDVRGVYDFIADCYAAGWYCLCMGMDPWSNIGVYN